LAAEGENSLAWICLNSKHKLCEPVNSNPIRFYSFHSFGKRRSGLDTVKHQAAAAAAKDATGRLCLVMKNHENLGRSPVCSQAKK